MFHENRKWNVIEVDDRGELAKKLVEHTWCCCNGFIHRGYYIINDSTSPNGAQEYGIVPVSDPTRQVESITFGWCGLLQATSYLRQIAESEFDEGFWGSGINPKQVTQDPTHHCHHCA